MGGGEKLLAMELEIHGGETWVLVCKEGMIKHENKWMGSIGYAIILFGGRSGFNH